MGHAHSSLTHSHLLLLDIIPEIDITTATAKTSIPVGFHFNDLYIWD